MNEREQFLSQKEARRRLLLALKDRGKGGFLNFATEPLLDPIEQRDAKNRRRPHPLLIVGGTLALLAFGAMFFISHTH